jgi:hypothetical protein
MSDKDDVKLIAMAQVNAFNGNAFNGSPAGIELLNNVGFKTATRSNPGVYVLELKRGRNRKHLNVFATRLNTAAGNIQAFLLDDTRIQVSNFADSSSEGQREFADSPFSIAVYHVDHD